MLKEAIEDAQRGHRGAIAWFAWDSESDGYLSFGLICRHLSVEPEWLRTLVAAHLAAHTFVPRERPAPLISAEAA